MKSSDKIENDVRAVIRKLEEAVFAFRILRLREDHTLSAKQRSATLAHTLPPKATMSAYLEIVEETVSRGADLYENRKMDPDQHRELRRLIRQASRDLDWGRQSLDSEKKAKKIRLFRLGQRIPPHNT